MVVNFNIQYTVDAGLLSNADEFRVNYLNNLPVSGYDGYVISNDVIERWIKTYTKHTESIMDIVICPKIVFEKHDFVRTQSYQYNYIEMRNNVKDFVIIEGKINEFKVMTIPSEVVALNSDLTVCRNIYFLYQNLWTLFMSTTVLYIYAWGDYMPNFWNVRYVAGFANLPFDVLNYVYKKALFDAYTHLGNTIIKPGVAGTSKSIDGVSESVTTTRSTSSTLFGAAKKELTEELNKLESDLKPIYKGFAMTRN